MWCKSLTHVTAPQAQLATSEEALAATAELVEQLQQQEGEWKHEISRLTNAEQGLAQELEAVRAKSDRAVRQPDPPPPPHLHAQLLPPGW